MRNEPLITVLMPVYNAEKFIAEAVNSVLNQDYSNWELLILNDASTDSTQSIIESFTDERIHVSNHSGNQGYLISCNELFDKTKGDFITFLDADDTCALNRLSCCLKQFDLNQKLDFLTTNYSRITEGGNLISENIAEMDYQRYATDLTYNPTICCATIFLKKELLNKVCGYRTVFQGIGGEDYYWLWELSCAGNGIHLNELLYDYRFHSAQTSIKHHDDLCLFLPELLAELRNEFKSDGWNDSKAETIKKSVRETYLNSPFQLNLRKAQAAINRKEIPFWIHTRKCLIQIRNLREFKSFLYLIYSCTIKNLRNEDL